MSKKAEKRAAARAEKQARFDAQRDHFISKVVDDGQPKTTLVVPAADVPRIAPHLARLADAAAQTPKAIVDGSRFSARMTWCVTKADQEGQWSWGESRSWTPAEWDGTINPGMTSLAGSSWQDIDGHSSGSGHKMHHGHELSDLIEEAQARWGHLGLDEFDSVFRFRIGGQKRRAWGYIVQAHFHFVWWDREHSLYPTAAS